LYGKKRTGEILLFKVKREELETLANSQKSGNAPEREKLPAQTRAPAGFQRYPQSRITLKIVTIRSLRLFAGEVLKDPPFSRARTRRQTVALFVFRESSMLFYTYFPEYKICLKEVHRT
jgi:hypothetical protein